MRIAVLDGHTLNPGDLSWEPLEALGCCTIHERTPPGLTVDRASGAKIVLTNKVVMDAQVMAHLPDLKYIGVLATGYNVVDVQAATARGIVVTNVPAYSTASVAQLVFAHILHFTHHVGEHSAGARNGRWSASPDFCYWNHPLVELDGLTMGIVGFGRIGRAVAQIARGFGMPVIFHNTGHPVETDGCKPVALDELFRSADVVSLHCPLTPATENLVNAERLRMMKPTAFLVNTSRGPVVDEPALAEALNNGTIAGAGVDVLSAEPPPPDNPLLSARNCSLTPHIAWASMAARRRLMETAVNNVRAFMAGSPINTVGR